MHSSTTVHLATGLSLRGPTTLSDTAMPPARRCPGRLHGLLNNQLREPYVCTHTLLAWYEGVRRVVDVAHTPVAAAAAISCFCSAGRMLPDVRAKIILTSHGWLAPENKHVDCILQVPLFVTNTTTTSALTNNCDTV